MLDAEIGSIMVQKKFMRSHLNKQKLGMVVCNCHPSYRRKQKIKGSLSRLAWVKNQNLFQK
jgi:hypothetical protein